MSTSEMAVDHEVENYPPEELTEDDRDMETEEEEEEAEEEEYDSEESDLEENEEVLAAMDRLKGTSKVFDSRFRLIKRIGEGTFSTVYKAEDLAYDYYENDWDLEEKEAQKWSTPPLKSRDHNITSPSRRGGKPSRGPKYVAIKQIYVTSSPARIQNELELLHDLRGSHSVCPLITAFRSHDQVIAVLPYFRHDDFRTFFRQMTVSEVRCYLRSLFRALAHVHRHKIIHRDIKPTNFLYDYQKQRGVLVDFGLAERQGTDAYPCRCEEPFDTESELKDARQPPTPSLGSIKEDKRPSRRANRAGTRGFRAPEVLMKCTAQTTKIDIWSAGVILLTILTKRFPFFNSADDVDALLEIATIFGKQRMRACAALHGVVFETNIPTLGERGFTFEKIVLWATNRTTSRESQTPEVKLTKEEGQAVAFMARCFEWDPRKRISARSALEHPFLAEVSDDEAMDDELNMV